MSQKKSLGKKYEYCEKHAPLKVSLGVMFWIVIIYGSYMLEWI